MQKPGGMEGDRLAKSKLCGSESCDERTLVDTVKDKSFFQVSTRTVQKVVGIIYFTESSAQNDVEKGFVVSIVNFAFGDSESYPYR